MPTAHVVHKVDEVNGIDEVDEVTSFHEVCGVQLK